MNRFEDRIMIIDIHTHIFPDALAQKTIAKLSAESHTLPFSDGTASGLRASMKEAGIAVSVVQQVATNPEKVSRINTLSAEYSGQDGLLYFGCIHPMMPEPEKEVRRIASLGLRGIKLHPVYQGCDIDDIRNLRILNAAAEAGLVVLTHAGWDIGFPGVDHCSPRKIAYAVSEVGAFPLIAAHLGGWRMWDALDVLLPYRNVYLDTSFSVGSLAPTEERYYPGKERYLLSPEQALSVIRKFGAERILFGSDSPWGSQKDSLSALCALPLTSEEQRKIFSENAENLLSLQKG